MARVAVLASSAPSLVNFRGPLLVDMVRAGHEVVGMAPSMETNIRQSLAEMGVSSVPVRHLERTGLNPIKDVRTLFYLRSVMSDIKPDVLLSYTAKPVIYGSIAATRAGVARIFSLITGLGYAFSGDSARQRALREVLFLLYRGALRSNEAVFFQNPDDQEVFRRAGCLPPTVRAFVVNGSGIDLERFGYVAPPEGPPRFIFVGRLLREKGVLELIEAAKLLRKTYPDLRVQLVGPFDTNPGAVAKNRVWEAVSEGVIEYAGPTQDVRPFLVESSVLVHPSYREGTPRAVLEAMATGRPVVTTDVPGCRQTVVDGESGFLVPPRDTVKLAEAMERFITIPSLVEKMGRAARHRAEAEFDVRTVNQTMLRAMELA